MSLGKSGFLKKQALVRIILMTLIFSQVILLLSACASIYISPLSLKKFDNILYRCKLQAPTSRFNKKYSCKYGKLLKCANKYFYLQDNKYMTFYMCGKKHRSELRFKDIWKTSTKKPKILKVTLKIKPINCFEFTFIQIHSYPAKKTSLNKPLVRLAWLKEKHKIKNHIWAVIRINTSKKHGKHSFIDLGKIPLTFFSIKIKVIRNKLSIFLNGKIKLIKDVSYWQQYYNYFKIGVYLQTKGCAKTEVDKIMVKY